MGVTVYLVGAGPGDVGLITVRGRELLERADAVIYDYLANPDLLELAPDRAERLYVGKKGFEAHVSQDEVNAIVVDTARLVDERKGSVVVRLKGGDPYLFGRGGEEALALARAGIPFEVVPGVTSGIAAAAYAGIPVTHRGLASSVTFVTGHEDLTKADSAIDWSALARMIARGGSACFYMGMRNLHVIAANLIERGVPEGMPAAVIQHGTGPRQRTVTSTVSGIASAARQAGLGAPSIIVVGAVVELRGLIAWFERKPLFGKRVVVTRARSQASALSGLLRELGAEVIEFPTIEIAQPDDYSKLDGAIGHLDDYDWLVFTSANGVSAFFERFSGDARSLAGVLVAAIGPATAGRLAQFGIAADAVPDEYRGEAVFSAIAAESEARGIPLSGARILVPRAQVAREALPGLLREAGATVDVVAAYKTAIPERAASGELAEAFATGGVDAVTFTSSSTVRNFMEAIDGDSLPFADVALCSIGPVTSDTLRSFGLTPTLEASRYTVDGLVSAMCAYFEREVDA